MGSNASHNRNKTSRNSLMWLNRQCKSGRDQRSNDTTLPFLPHVVRTYKSIGNTWKKHPFVYTLYFWWLRLTLIPIWPPVPHQINDHHYSIYLWKYAHSILELKYVIFSVKDTEDNFRQSITLHKYFQSSPVDTDRVNWSADYMLITIVSTMRVMATAMAIPLKLSWLI